MAVVGVITNSNTKENKLFKVFKSGGEMNTVLINGTILKIFNTFNDKHNNNNISSLKLPTF